MTLNVGTPGEETMARAASAQPTIWTSRRLPLRPVLLLLLASLLVAGVGWLAWARLLNQNQAAVAYQTSTVTRGSVVSVITATGRLPARPVSR